MYPPRLQVIHNDTNAFSIIVFVPAGSIYESNKVRGGSHMLEHMVFRNHKSIIKELTSIGTFNASTGKDVTSYYIHSTVAHMEMVITCMKRLVGAATFTPKDLEIERKVILEEYYLSGAHFGDNFNDISIGKMLAADNPYLNTVIGTEKSIKSITHEQLKKYFQERYCNYTMTINCPKSHEKRAVALVYEHFTDIEKPFDYGGVKPRRAPAAKPSPGSPPPKSPGSPAPGSSPEPSADSRATVMYEYNDPYITVIKSPMATQNATRLMFPSYIAHDGVSLARLAFLTYVLTSSALNSLLHQEIRSARGMVYGIHSYSESLRNMGIFLISFSSSYRDVAHIVNIVCSVLQRMKRRGLTKKQLEYYKEGFVNTYQARFKSPEFVTDWSGTAHFYGDTVTSKEKLFRIVRSIQNKDVRRTAREVFNFENCSVLSAGSYNHPDRVSLKILDIIRSQ